MSKVFKKELAHSRGFEPLTSAFGGQRAYKPTTTGRSLFIHVINGLSVARRL